MKNKQSGFTLIEMLVVVAIVGLLSSVVVIGVGGARQKARDTKRIADLRSIQTWAEANYTNAYPTAAMWTAWAGQGQPKDPLGGNYDYTQCTSDGVPFYVAHAKLEDADNRPTGGGVSPAPAGCTATCDNSTNYCVAPSS